MKKAFITLTAFLSLNFVLTAQIDYSFSAQMQTNTTICESGSPLSTTISFVLTDAGMNGDPTYYQYVSDDGLSFVNPDGFINDGQSFPLVNIVGATGVAPGTYTFEVQASNLADFSEDVVSISYTITVEDEPDVTIATPDGIYICDGTPIALEGDPGLGGADSYSWAPNGETTQDITASTPGTYMLTATNSCGSNSASVDVLQGSAPELDNFNCNASGSANAINIFSDALDPDGLGVTVQWYRNGVAIFDGGDYDINTSADNLSSNLKVGSVQANHVGAQFQVVYTNACGSISSPICTNMGLPVELTYFSGGLKEGESHLEWETASEVNSDYFAVERSYDGKSFKEVGSVLSAGESNVDIQYNFIDRTPFEYVNAESVYYRLRQVDIDGSFVYSNVIALARTETNQLQLEGVVFSGDQLQVQLFAPRQGKLEANIYNLSGQLLAQRQLSIPDGHTQVYLDNLDLPSGLFLIQINDGFHSDTKKFVR
ncbi:MAG: T9SS type A sorting domain-containing protein [Bacteroidetes bacterium]|nr:T9SS type A sorting domain-containing protein [Bacteroidota bacterium]